MEQDLKESDNRSFEIFYSRRGFCGLRKDMKGQRRSGVTVKVRTVTHFPLHRMYIVITTCTKLFCDHDIFLYSRTVS
jgi:hypothetical protein